MGKRSKRMLALALIVGTALGPIAAAAEEEAAASPASLEVRHAPELAAELGVLLGDGQGVTETYLAKATTRVQGAILTLRLLGKEQEALAYEGTQSFADASSVGSSIRPVLSYLKDHPELGWAGTGGNRFSPNEPITAQQVYKVMLESLGYRAGADFEYADTLSFAAGKGLTRAANATPFTNRDLAVALVETLLTSPKGGADPLADALAEHGVITADQAAALNGKRIDLRAAADGSSYLTDGNGRALYLFTRDMANLNACTGNCLTAWPVLEADRLLLADGLESGDFGSFIREDGTKQVTYKGWPLYYWANDKEPGDAGGDGVNKVWYLVKQPFYTITLGTDPNLGINYLVDAGGKSLYYFDQDPQGASVCSGDCLTKWPAFHGDPIVVPSSLNAEDFGEIIRPDGAKQTTFKGYPLYYWFQDESRGDIKGHNVGEVWFLVDPENFAGTTADGKTAERVTIEMKNYAFSAPEITVKAGSVITFVNRDNDKHNAVAVGGEFRTPLLTQGQSVSIKLDEPGTYAYYCEPHKDHMKAKIIVV